MASRCVPKHTHPVCVSPPQPLHTVRAYGTVVLVWLISLLAQYDRFVISFFSTEVRAHTQLAATLTHTPAHT